MTKAKKPLLLRTWDIESINWNELVIASLYDGEKTYFAYTPKEIIKTMIKLKGVFYAHFGGGFDNLFLLEELKNYNITIKNIKGNLIRIGVYYKNSKKKLFELRDSFPILPDGLEKLRESFGVEIPISVEKWSYYKSRRNNIQDFTDEELKEYVAVDSIVLYRVLKKALEVFECDDFSLTIASESKRRFSNMYNIKKLWLPSKLDGFFRQAYSGGRVEVFKRYGKNLKQYDFKSMYSSVMLKNEYPSGLAVYTATYNPDKLGIYTVEIEAPKLHIPLLHTYQDKKLIFPTGKWEGTYTSVELEKAKSLGYKFKVICGYYFTQRCRPFIEYVEYFYSLKQEAEDKGQKALRYIAKLYLNSLYGKFGQRRIFSKVMKIKGSLRDMMRKHKVTDVMHDMGMVIVEDETRSPFTTVHIACFVTAYARLSLYEAIEKAQSLGGEIYYCDTDCIVTDATMETGKQLGDLDIEGDIKEAWFLSPKFYAFYGNKKTFRYPDGIPTTRAKGLSSRYLVEDYKFAFDNNNYGKFSENRNSIIGLLEGHRRHINYLEVINRERKVKGLFTKRLINSDNNTTKPYNL